MVLDCALLTKKYNSIVFLTNDLSCENLAGYPVLHEQNYDLEKLRLYADDFIIAIGDNTVRMEKFRLFKNYGFTPATIIHPSAVISSYATIGEGVVVFANCVVNSYATIGNACILNTSCIVEHDCILEDGVHISPNSVLGGSVFVGTQSWICLGVSVSHDIQIGKNTIIGSGSSVINNIPDYVLAVGTPAFVKKSYKEI